MSESRNIYQRINAVMTEIDYVQKDAEVQGYKAVTHDAVVGLVRKQMVEQGIVVRLEQTKGKVIQFRAPKEDIKQHFYSGTYAVHFVNIDNPEDFMTCVVNAHAMDTQDKAPGKAASYAVKYAMLKTFSIETGENEESRYFERPLYTEEQFAVFHDLIEQEKAYELYLFVQTQPEETVIALTASFPEGKKTQGKKKARELTENGHAIFRDVVEDVQSLYRRLYWISHCCSPLKL